METSGPHDLKYGLARLATPKHGHLPLALCDIVVEEVKDGSGKPVRFEGYGSVWDRVDAYGDTVRQGAFTEALKARTPMMFLQHNPRVVPGKWLSATEDQKGLKLTGELTPGHSDAQNLAASLKHASMNGLSIGGWTTKAEVNNEDDTRAIIAFDLWEVSPVSMPAETEARIDTSTVKAMLDGYGKLSDFEDFLREACGLSKSAALAWVSRFARIARGENVESGAAKAIAEMSRAIEVPMSLPSF